MEYLQQVGTLVYQGADPNEGWNGTYKGVIQPQDVYHYTLLVEFAVKKKQLKKAILPYFDN